MFRILPQVSLLAIGLFGSPSFSENGFEFVAGVGKADLPAVKVGDPLGDGSFAAVNGWEFDTPTVRAVYFSDGKDAVNIVSVDALYVYGHQARKIIAELATYGLEGELLIVASHVHSSLAVTQEDDAVDKAMRTAIVSAVKDAQEGAAPAVVGHGRGQYQAAFNRVLRSEQGSQTWWSTCYEDLLNSWRIAHPDPVDDSVSVVSVWAADNSFSTILFNYAAHPVTFNGNWPTAGFPAQARRLLERTTNWPAMFLQGFAGDINVPCTARESTEAHIAMARFGDGLGSVALSVAMNIKNFSSDIDLQTSSSEIQFENQCPGIGIEQLVVKSVSIGEEIAVVGVSGEPFTLIGRELRTELEQRGYATILLTGYTNGTARYIPDFSAWGSGAYGTTVPGEKNEMCVPRETAKLIVESVKGHFDGFSN